jgi:hypothetical protein
MQMPESPVCAILFCPGEGLAGILDLEWRSISIMREGLIKTLDNIPADSISGPPLQIQNTSQPCTLKLADPRMSGDSAQDPGIAVKRY